ncbi:Pre-mRNA cleavage complex II Clp1 [Venturia nashicola]|nr:Pre-mRNA cleavage complex II Clp1 [Venturia nashicola]
MSKKRKANGTKRIENASSASIENASSASIENASSASIENASSASIENASSASIENAISASITIPTAPLSAFAAARAKAKLASSGPVVHDEVARNISVETTGKKKTKRSKIANPSQPQSPPRRKEKVAKLDQDDAFDEEHVFSQFVSFSKHSMPEPYKPPSRDHDYESDEVSELATAEVVMVDAVSDEQTVPMSSWSQTKGNCVYGNSKCERLSMENGETLSIWGRYRLQVHEGLVTIAGAFLAAEAPALEVHAPSTSSIPVIKCIKSEGAVIEVSSIRADEHTTEVLERLSSLYNPETSAIWARFTDSQQSFSKILDAQPTSKTGGFLPLDIPKTWQERINGFCSSKTSSTPTIQLCGPANVGKSTFAAILINSLLTGPRAVKKSRPVAYLDLDQNKQEYGPPGQISLVLVKQPNLKPRFARSTFNDGENKVVRAHAIRLDGHKEDMKHFLDAASDLMHHYHSWSKGENQAAALIVNCPIWFQASGYDLTVNLTETLKPSHIMCFASGPAKVLNWVHKAAGTASLEILPPQPYFNINKSPRTAAEVNEMHMVSYFHSDSSEQKAAKWNALPLSHQRPFDVSYGEKGADFAGVFIFGEVPVMYPNMLSTLLNGSIVSIVAIEEASLLNNREVLRGEDDRIPFFTVGPRGYTIPFEPRKSRTLGLGLIRGINAKAQTMQIVTPVPAKQMAEIASDRLVLAFGGFESPGWAYLEEMYYQEWAQGQGRTVTVSDMAAAWIEEMDGVEEGKRVGGLGMQVWKTRRFQ